MLNQSIFHVIYSQLSYFLYLGHSPNDRQVQCDLLMAIHNNDKLYRHQNDIEYDYEQKYYLQIEPLKNDSKFKIPSRQPLTARVDPLHFENINVLPKIIISSVPRPSSKKDKDVLREISDYLSFLELIVAITFRASIMSSRQAASIIKIIKIIKPPTLFLNALILMSDSDEQQNQRPFQYISRLYWIRFHLPRISNLKSMQEQVHQQLYSLFGQ